MTSFELWAGWGIIISLFNVPTAGTQASSLREGWAVIHHACPVQIGVFEFLVVGHAGFLTMFFFTVLRAVVMK